MPLSSFEADRVRILHMIDAGKQPLEFARDRSRGDLDSNAMFRRAVVHCLQEIGEAAVQISQDTRAVLPGVPWTQITRMRNRLVHGYFAVNLDLVWDVISNELNPLIEDLERFPDSQK